MTALVAPVVAILRRYLCSAGCDRLRAVDVALPTHRDDDWYALVRACCDGLPALRDAAFRFPAAPWRSLRTLLEFAWFGGRWHRFALDVACDDAAALFAFDRPPLRRCDAAGGLSALSLRVRSSRRFRAVDALRDALAAQSATLVDLECDVSDTGWIPPSAPADDATPIQWPRLRALRLNLSRTGLAPTEVGRVLGWFVPADRLVTVELRVEENDNGPRLWAVLQTAADAWPRLRSLDRAALCPRGRAPHGAAGTHTCATTAAGNRRRRAPPCCAPTTSNPPVSSHAPTTTRTMRMRTTFGRIENPHFFFNRDDVSGFRPSLLLDSQGVAA